MVKIKDTLSETIYFTVNKYNIIVRQRNVVTGDDMVIEFPRRKNNLDKILNYLKKRMILKEPPQQPKGDLKWKNHKHLKNGKK